MHPVWFHLFGFPVRAYSTLFVAAFLGGLAVTLYIAKAEGHPDWVPHFWNLAPWLLVFGLVGSRLWQVAFFEPQYYAMNPGEALAIWHGGLSIQGGIVGAIVYGVLYLRRHRLPVWLFADLTAPGILIGQSIGRDANLMNGDAFGNPTHRGFGILYPSQSLAQQVYGGQPLWPAEIWEGQADILLFVVVIVLMQRRLPSGTIFLTFLVLYNMVRFGLEFLRGDSPHYLFGWDAAQWTSAPMMVVGMGLLIWRFTRETAHQTHRQP